MKPKSASTTTTIRMIQRMLMSLLPWGPSPTADRKRTAERPFRLRPWSDRDGCRLGVRRRGVHAAEEHEGGDGPDTRDHAERRKRPVVPARERCGREVTRLR